MKIAVFCYDFPHQKTIDGLIHLKSYQYDDVTCFAAPKKTLKIASSKTRITPFKIHTLHPWLVAKSLDYEYLVIEHDSDSLTYELKKFDIGIVLGARILSKEITNSLSILNMHPGVLPENRNLDNIKWAIATHLPQGVSTHIIDQNVDRGLLLDISLIDVFHDDTFMDLFLRVRGQEMNSMIECLKAIKNKTYSLEILGKGNYFTAMPDELDKTLTERFEIYKSNYNQIRSKYIESKRSISHLWKAKSH